MHFVLSLPWWVLSLAFQVVFSPSGNRLAVLDIAGGVTLVETSKGAANASPYGRRYDHGFNFGTPLLGYFGHVMGASKLGDSVA